MELTAATGRMEIDRHAEGTPHPDRSSASGTTGCRQCAQNQPDRLQRTFLDFDDRRM
jgi:hypothetical protein